MKSKLSLVVLVLIVMLSGCITVQVPEEFKGSGVFEVVLVQPTGAVQLAQEPAATSTPFPTETPLPSPTPLPATATPLPTEPRATTVPAALTLVVDVTLNANCRSGPGVSYAVLRYLLQGQTVEVVGRTASGGWWLVRETPEAEPCWVTLRALEYSVEMAGVPVVTPAAPAGSVVAQQDDDNTRTRTGGGGQGTRPTSSAPPTEKPPTEEPPTEEPPTEEPYPPPREETPNPYP